MTGKILAKAVFITLLLAAVPLVAAQSNANNESLAGLVQHLATTRKALAEGYLRWIDATKAKDVDAVLKLYTDDAVVLPDGAEIATGKDAIRQFYQKWYAGLDKLEQQQFTEKDLALSGDLAIQTAEYSGVVNAAGKEVAFKGKNLVIWKRQSDGSWKIFRDIWNGSPGQ